MPRPMDCHVAALLAMTLRLNRATQHRTHPPSLRAKRGNPVGAGNAEAHGLPRRCAPRNDVEVEPRDRKSTRLNSSHVRISYAVFCLKKKKKKKVSNTKKHNKE